MSKHEKLMDFIKSCADPGKLRSLIQNARKQSAKDVKEAAFRKLISIVPSEKSGTVEHHLWQTVIAFEEILTMERGKTTRLSRTRQKIARVGEIRTLIDWALSEKKTDGFDMLLERGMPELTGEAIVLQHTDYFSTNVIEAAKSRLVAAGVNVEKF